MDGHALKGMDSNMNKKSSKKQKTTNLVKQSIEYNERTSRIHPAFMKIVGNTILAAANPRGFHEGMKERIFLNLMSKTYEWLENANGQERAVHIYTNIEEGICITFTENRKECKGPCP